jgi:hypothetical protein
MHQQPPKMPPFRSTSAANAGQLDSSKALTLYAGTSMSLTGPDWLDGADARLGQRPLT